MSFIYLMSPHTHPDVEVQQARYEAALRHASFWLKEGWNVYSPIVHSHEMHKLNALPHHRWLEFDFSMLRHAAAGWVLTLEGWQQSKGIEMERQFCLKAGIPVKYFDPFL